MLHLRLHTRLDRFDLDVEADCAGPVTAVFGPSGAGKTTLLQLIAGLRRPDAGRIELDGRVLFCDDEGTDTPPEKRRLGVVFQDDLLFPHLTVRQNLLFGHDLLAPAARRLAPERVIDLLEVGPLLDGRPTNLSGGERQRVALGRALLSSPDLLLMDEPLASLDQGLKSRIIPYLRHVRSDLGIPILYVSHSVAEILELTRQVLVLRRGRVVAHGDLFDVARNAEVLPLLDEHGFDNVLPVVIVDSDGGACIGRCGEQMLRLPACDAAPGTHLFVGVRADDVILARHPPEGLSVRNRLRGVVRQIDAVGDTRLVTLDVGHPLVAKVTPEAVADLGLAPGQQAWSLIKTHSLRLGPPMD